MLCILRSFNLVTICASNLIGSWSRNSQNYVLPLLVGTKYSLGRIPSILVYLSEYPIANPELSHLYLLIVVTSYFLLVGDCYF